MFGPIWLPNLQNSIWENGQSFNTNKDSTWKATDILLPNLQKSLWTRKYSAGTPKDKAKHLTVKSATTVFLEKVMLTSISIQLIKIHTKCFSVLFVKKLLKTLQASTRMSDKNIINNKGNFHTTGVFHLISKSLLSNINLP